MHYIFYVGSLTDGVIVGLKLRDLYRVAYEMSLGVQHLHANQRYHRDLAIRNWVQSASGTSRLIDFGMSQPVKDVNACSVF